MASGSLEEVRLEPVQISDDVCRILVVDRDPMSSDLLANALSQDNKINAFGIPAVSLLRAATTENAETIDLVIIGADAACENRNGFDLAKSVSSACPNVRIVMLLSQSTRDSVLRTFRSGAHGAVSREQPTAELIECIESVRRGLIWAGPREASFLLQAIRTLPALDFLQSEASALLTERELQVVKCAATGKTNRKIAGDLGLSEHTVKNYLFRAFEKLGVSSRVELLFYLTLNGHSLDSSGASGAMNE
jgi:two-component system, NarL family, nitrate/nitrite response regulator NarL